MIGRRAKEYDIGEVYTTLSRVTKLGTDIKVKTFEVILQNGEIHINP
jgi:hypothetical protein